MVNASFVASSLTTCQTGCLTNFSCKAWTLSKPTSTCFRKYHYFALTPRLRNIAKLFCPYFPFGSRRNTGLLLFVAIETYRISHANSSHNYNITVLFRFPFLEEKPVTNWCQYYKTLFGGNLFLQNYQIAKKYPIPNCTQLLPFYLELHSQNCAKKFSIIFSRNKSRIRIEAMRRYLL